MAGEDEFHDDNPPLPPPPVTPTQQAPHTLSTIKLPIMKKGEYDIWAMKMEHYLGHTDYPIWEIIQKGNGPVQVSTDIKLTNKEDHLAKFHKITDAKEIWYEAIIPSTGATVFAYDMRYCQGFGVMSSMRMEADESDDPDDIAEIFKIEGNLFNFEKPLCKAFNEFNYLLKIDTDLFTFDIQGNQTYEECELNNTMTRDLEEPWLDNGVPYQICDHICKPYRFNNGKTKWPTCSSDIDGFCNGGELLGMVRVRSMTYFQDHKWNYGVDNANYTQENLKHKKEHHDPSTCHVRRFEMIKYSFDADDEYVSIKEHECSKHSETNIDTCQAY
ncbi:hypothetical protein Tco_1351847 [Tanacetum coccineum]